MADRNLNIVLLGSGGTGKSTLTVKYVQNIFIDKYDPTIEDSYRKTKIINDKIYTLEILDTAGTEQFLTMRDLYIKTGHGFILVYTIISHTSFSDLEPIYTQIIRCKEQSVPIILCATKHDLLDDRVISYDSGQNKAKMWNCDFIETSAKTGYNVDQCFNILCNKIIEQREILNVNKKHKKCTML